MKYAMQYVYPALFAQKKEGGYAIEFPDFPWLHAKGKTWTTAFAAAEEALNRWLWHAEEEGKALPQTYQPSCPHTRCRRLHFPHQSRYLGIPQKTRHPHDRPHDHPAQMAGHHGPGTSHQLLHAPPKHLNGNVPPQPLKQLPQKALHRPMQGFAVIIKFRAPAKHGDLVSSTSPKSSILRH